MNEDGLGNGLISGSERHIDYLFITTVKYLRVREAPLWLNNIHKLTFCHVTSSQPHSPICKRNRGLVFQIIFLACYQNYSIALYFSDKTLLDKETFNTKTILC